MSNLTQRNIEILKIIVEEFLQTWEVIGSKALLKKYDLWVSSATVRNDMALLESLELIYQPYNSAGRLPTSKWLRAFINFLMKSTPEHFLSESGVKVNKQDTKTLEDFIYQIISELAKKTQEISFFIVPDDAILQYSGVAHFLEKNYKMLGESIFGIIKMLEDKNAFSTFISHLPLNHGVNVFLWEENITPFLHDYSLIVRPISINGKIGYIWVIWSLKMNYSFNISAVKWII